MPDEDARSSPTGGMNRARFAAAILMVILLIAIVVGFAVWNSTSENHTASVATSFSLSDALREVRFGGHIAAATTDLKGNLWIGTEGNGIYQCDPSAPGGSRWTHYSTNDGLGDNNGLCLACDRLGRVWVGHLNHGVSVYNGQRWQRYDVVGAVDGNGCLSGPLGNHVRAIAICPTDGDVWMATSAGLARYSESTQHWNYYTRGQGLGCDQANAIAFDKSGNIYLATPSEGVAMADAEGGYKTWRQVNGPQQLLTKAEGTGLPSNLINDVLWAGDGTLYAATPAGLGWSTDRGVNWHYRRGRDWADKVRNSAGGVPDGWQESHEVALLAEDDVTCLAEEANGTIDVGYGQLGTGQITHNGDSISIEAGRHASGLVRCLSAGSGRYSVAGTDDGGVFALDESNVASVRSATLTPLAPAVLPAEAQGGVVDELNHWLNEMALVPPAPKTDAPMVIPLADDWSTQGAWIGRYGRYSAAISAISNPNPDYLWGAGPTPMQYAVRMGDHHRENDSMRYYIATLYTKDPRVLEIPPVYLDSRVIKKLTTRDKDRRQAEWNDNSETYPPTYEGPDLFCSVSVPAGLFFMSFYEIDDDGKSGVRAMRDEEFIIKAHSPSDQGLDDISGFDESPTLASGRASDFWSGVYKRFCVQGPTVLTIKLHRTYADVMKVSALMLDMVDEHPVPYFVSPSDWDEEQKRRQSKVETQATAWTTAPGDRAQQFTAEADPSRAAAKLLENLDSMRDWNPAWWAMNHLQIAIVLARWYEGQALAHPLGGEEAAHLATSLYYSGLYPAWESADRAAGHRTARDIEKALRWDQKIPAYSGRGFKTVTEYLAAHLGEH